MKKKVLYVEIHEHQLPDGVRFDVPARNQGQMIEVAYGGLEASEHDVGDQFKRVIDRSQQPLAPRFYKFAGLVEA